MLVKAVDASAIGALIFADLAADDLMLELTSLPMPGFKILYEILCRCCRNIFQERSWLPG